MSGGYEYNLTTESEFEEMKQKNQELIEQNYNLKKTLEELLKVNNELSDTVEYINNSEWARSKNAKELESQNKQFANHEEYEKLIHGLEQEVEYFKRVAEEKMQGDDHVEIFNTLDNLIESFKQTQKYYEDELTSYSEEIDTLKNEWEAKIFKISQQYFQKTRVLDEIIKEMKRKEEIVSIIEKKMGEENRNSRKLGSKNNELETSSERRLGGGSQSLRHLENSSKEKSQQKLEVLVSQKEIEDLKLREKKLNEQLKQKDKTIGVYTELLGKLRRKLAEKL